jgi:hypothetical protein
MSLYKEITVGQFQDIQAIDKEVTPYERVIYCVSILKGITYNEACKMPRKKFEKMAEEYSKVDYSKWNKQKILSKIKIGNNIYKVQPNPLKVNAGQLLDNINLFKDNVGSDINIMDKRLASIMNCDKIEHQTLAERAALVRDVPIYLLYTTYLFFFKQLKHCYPNTEGFLAQRMEAMLTVSKEILAAGGDYSQS